jgi:hypothetical protein
MKRKYTTHGRIVREHFASYSTTFNAFCELINNSLQANAKHISITLTEPTSPVPQSAYECIVIQDDGLGVAESDVNNKLLHVGTTVKAGGRGIGRFGALQIGKKVEIETVAYDENKRAFTKVIVPLVSPEESLQDSSFESKEETLKTKNIKPYCKITIQDFYNPDEIKQYKKRKIDIRFRLENIRLALFEQYATQIFTEKIILAINGEVIKPKEFVVGKPQHKKSIYTDKSGQEHNIEFDFFKIQSVASDIKVFIRTEQIGIIETLTYSAKHLDPNVGTWFIYVNSDQEVFPVDFSHRWDIKSMDEEILHLKTYIQNEIDSFFKKINKAFETFTELLIQDEFYPFAHIEPSSESQRLVFNQFAYILEEKYQLIKGNQNLRGLIYPLVERSLTQGDFQRILEILPGLNKDISMQFISLLEKAELSDVVVFSDNVASKVQFLDFLHEIIYGESAKYIKERSQLHKVIEKNLWIFGENYTNTPVLFSDKQIGNTLEALAEQFLRFIPNKDNDTLIEQPTSVPGLNNITDLFFFNDKPRDDGKREIMIVELKAPTVRLGNSELQQIGKYAFTIEEQAIFPADNIAYKLILISSEVTKYVKSDLKTAAEAYQVPFLYKHMKSDKDIQVFIMTWSELIAHNRRKLNFLSNTLNTKDVEVTKTFKKDFSHININNLESKLGKSRE